MINKILILLVLLPLFTILIQISYSQLIDNNTSITNSKQSNSQNNISLELQNNLIGNFNDDGMGILDSDIITKNPICSFYLVN
jgi:hypothetical protein